MLDTHSTCEGIYCRLRIPGGENTMDFPYPHTTDDYEIISHFSPSRTRRRTLSQVSTTSSHSSKIAFDFPKAPPASTITVKPGKHNAFGSFTTMSSASHSLKSFLQPKSYKSSLARLSSRETRRPPPIWTVNYDSESTEPSVPSSPLSTHSTVPSISRTLSSSSAVEVESAALTPLLHPKASNGKGKARAESTKMHPILESMERNSRLCGRAICVTCHKPGYDFPRCARCGDMWCSRACRLHGGLKRHVCSRRDT